MSRHVELLSISRGRFYYLPRPRPAVDPALKRQVDELHLDLHRSTDATKL